MKTGKNYIYIVLLGMTVLALADILIKIQIYARFTTIDRKSAM